MMNAKLNPDGTVKLSIGNESINLTASSLDNHIVLLTAIRANMAEKHPEEPPPVQEVVVNPAYRMRTDKITKACLLRIRHEGLGWLNFELPPQEALNMRRIWNSVVERLELEPESDIHGIADETSSKLH